MKIGAVINNASGTLPPQETKDRLEEIKQHLEARVSSGCLAIVPGSQIGREVERLKAQGMDVLIIGGGDGTVSTAARLVGDTKISLAVIALGTRNHFAHDVGIPLEPMEAIRLLDGMKVKLIDLGEVNGHKFINNATLGLYPNIVKERENNIQKRGWSKWWAQIGATLVVLKRLPRIRMTVEGKGFRVKLFAPFLFVGNNEYQGISNSDYSRLSISGGRLWLCMARSSGIWALLLMAWQLSIKGIQGAENLETRLLTEVTVSPRRRNITVAIDGENHKLATPLRFKIRKKSLRVMVP